MGLFRFILSKISGRTPSVTSMDTQTLAWNVRDGKLFGCKEDTHGVRSVVEIGGGGDPNPVDLTHFCYIAWRDAPGDGFTLDPNNALSYEAILYTHTEIAEPVEADFDGLWRFRGDLTQVDDLNFDFRDIEGKAMTYVLILKASFAFQIESLWAVCDAATSINGVSIKINGTAVTGISAVSVTTTPQEFTATDHKIVSVGDTITLTATGITGTPTEIVGTIKRWRI